MALIAIRRPEVPVRDLRVAAYLIPTDYPEADGTLEWHDTGLVLVEVKAGNETGIGYTYGPARPIAFLIADVLKEAVEGTDAMDVETIWWKMVHVVRNAGRPGIASMAISAVDAALWDLKARLLKVPLVSLLGAAREHIPAYGSGGFTTCSSERLLAQFGEWAQQGIKRFKLKVGRRESDDIQRVRDLREALGPEADLRVDANGAFSRKEALRYAHQFQQWDVSWFEEPASSDDLEGLRLIRDEGPPGMDITAGEYGYDLGYFRRMLESGAVDVLQADATRCAGITEFLRVGALCQAFGIPLSAHTAPSLHLHPCCALGPVRDIEYFHDHVRIEQMLFDGTARPRGDGHLAPDMARPGMGLEFRRADAARYEVA